MKIQEKVFLRAIIFGYMIVMMTIFIALFCIWCVKRNRVNMCTLQKPIFLSKPRLWSILSLPNDTRDLLVMLGPMSVIIRANIFFAI